MTKYLHKLITCILLLLFCLLLRDPVWAAPTVVLDTRNVAFDVPPVVKDGHTLVPLRALFEALGATVSWDDSTQIITATKANTEIQLKIGQCTAMKNGTEIKLDVPAMILEGRTMVPLRFIVEAFDGVVGFDSKKQIITIHSNKQPTAQVEWNYSFPIKYEVIPWIVKQTSDGGYIVCGTKSNDTTADSKEAIFLLKTNKQGIKQWEKVVIDGFSPEWIVENKDNYVIFSSDYPKSQLITTDLQGNWRSTIKLNGSVSMKPTKDGYLLYSGSQLASFDQNDVLNWNTDIPDSFIVSILEAEDGFVVLGTNESKPTNGVIDVSSSQPVFVWKLNNQGKIMWKKSYTDGRGGFPMHIVSCKDDGYIISVSDGGWENTNVSEAIKIAADGSVEWKKPFGGPSKESIEEIVDTGTGFVFAGTTDSFGAGADDAYLAMFDYQGNLQWEKTVGSSFDELGDAVCVTSDGGLVMAIRAETDGTSFNKVQLVKLH